MNEYIIHKEMQSGGWAKMSFIEQMANIGSEVSRTRKWQGKNEKNFDGAVDRYLELIDLTIRDERWRFRLKELTRARELFLANIFGGETYGVTLEYLDKYFFDFAVARSNGRN